VTAVDPLNVEDVNVMPELNVNALVVAPLPTVTPLKYNVDPLAYRAFVVTGGIPLNKVIPLDITR